MEQITSSSNPRFKAALRLKQNRGRKQQRRSLVVGEREVGMALANGIALEELFVCAGRWADRSEWYHLRAGCRAARIDCFELAEPLFDKLCYGQRETAVVACARRPQRQLGELELPEQFLVCVVEGVEKPGNLGAVMRSAEAAGAHGVLVADAQCDPFHPNCIRASMGTVFAIPWVETTSVAALAFLIKRRAKLYASRVDGAIPYDSCDWTSASAIVVGSEAAGLGRLWEQPGVQNIAIPMRGSVDSLNLSVSAAVLLFEAARQRRNALPL